MKIRIGSRKSDLAQIQARLVASEIKKYFPEAQIEHVFKDVAVDLDLNLDLTKSESKGLFTKDLSQDLHAGRVDLVVHSWKDLPTSLPIISNAESEVVATLKRADPRDLVLVKKDALKKGKLRFLSSSPRRDFNLGAFLKNYVFPKNEVVFEQIRGNVPTRLNKFLNSDVEGLVLAHAAIERLIANGTEESRQAIQKAFQASHLLLSPLSLNPPAPAQGALAIEALKTRTDLKKILSALNCSKTFTDVLWERDRLKLYGGGCHLKLGIFAKSLSPTSFLVSERGLSPSGETLERFEVERKTALPQFQKEEIFDSTSLDLFDRKDIANLSLHQGPGVIGQRLYFVSKAEALPESWICEGDILWTAGLSTWKKLREKGYWVSGTQESLGESALPLPLVLWPAHKAFKIAHKEAPEKEIPLCPTYELVRNDKPLPSLKAFKAFFWKSASLFEECLKTEPSLINAHHACGMGNTYEELSQKVPAERLLPFTDLKEFLKKCSKSS